MPIVELAGLAALPRGASAGSRLIGLDLGTKTIGLALSDVGRSIATPMETIARVKFGRDAARLLEIAAAQGAGGLVLGLPLNLDGTEGPRAQSTRSFARALTGLTALPLAYQDERLSTAAVLRALHAEDATRARRAKDVDRMAAAYILQIALDRLAGQEPPSQEPPSQKPPSQEPPPQ